MPSWFVIALAGCALYCFLALTQCVYVVVWEVIFHRLSARAAWAAAVMVLACLAVIGEYVLIDKGEVSLWLVCGAMLVTGSVYLFGGGDRLVRRSLLGKQERA